MSIIPCPECGKKISSQAPICSHCGFQSGDVSEDDLRKFLSRKLRDRIYHLNMTSYAVITVFVAAFGWHWWDSGGFQQSSTAGPFLLMGLSALAYLIVRGFLFRARQKQKQMRRQEFARAPLRD